TYIKHVNNRDDLTFDESEFLRRLTGLKTVSQANSNRYYTYPQFFLDSLVYNSKDDWVMWINGIKITPRSRDNVKNLAIREVGPETVTLEWAPEQMNRVLDNWEHQSNDKITVDEINEKVLFK